MTFKLSAADSRVARGFGQGAIESGERPVVTRLSPPWPRKPRR
jgi:hypothetical protein